MSADKILGYKIGVHIAIFCPSGVQNRGTKNNMKLAMAYLKIRGKTYYAVWRQNGEKVCKTTGISVKSNIVSPSQSKRLAQEVADTMEKAALGEIVTHKAMAAVRSSSEKAGLVRIPTTREWLEKDFSKRRPEHLAMARRFCSLIGKDADRAIDCLSPSTIEAYYRKELESISFSSLSNYKGLLSACFNRALYDNLIPFNPFERTRLPNVDREKHKKMAFTLEQLHHMIATFPDPWPAMIQVSFLTGGQRLGDVATLKWENIDFRARTICFTTQKVKRDMVITMHDQLYNVLMNLKNDSEYVFPYAAERYKKKGYLSNDFSLLVYKAGFVEKPKEKLQGRRLHVNPLTFHSIRHSVVSLLRSSSFITPDIARSIVGHASEAVERAYFHAPNASLEAGYNYLDSSLKKASPLLENEQG